MKPSIQWMRFLVLLLLLSAINWTCTKIREADNKTVQRPNVLVFLIEELNFETLPVYGNFETRVPKIHQLSQESYVFEKAYVTQPVCTPSRGSILTGKYPHRGPLSFNNSWSQIIGGVSGTYVANPEIVKQVVPFTTYLPREDIATCYIGKWHIGPERTHAVDYFDEYWSILHKFRERKDEPYSGYNYWAQEKGLVPDQPDGTFGYKRMVNMPREFSRLTFMDEKAKDFISNKSDQPWVMFYSPQEVHTPNTGPYNSLFAPSEISLDSAYYAGPNDDAPLRHHIRAQKWSLGLSEKQKKDELVRYYGKLYDVDKSIGDIVNHLKETGQYDNTLIIFTADHGAMTNRKGYQTKMMMFEHSARVPFLVKMPRQKEMHKVESPISLIDLLPTIFDAMQVDIPESFDGKSLLPVMQGEAKPSPVVIQWHPINPGKWEQTFGKKEIRERVSAARFNNAISQKMRCWVDPAGFKLVLTDNYKDKNQLYDINSDPFEFRNLYYQEGYADKVKELEEQLLNWQQQYQDTISLSLYQN